MPARLISCGLTAVLFMTLLGCGSSSDRKDSEEAPVLSTLKGTFQVPAGFPGSPKMLAVSGYRSWPPTGMPDAFFHMKQDPVIALDTPYVYEITEIEYAGEYYIAGFLYVAGSTMPVCAKDYLALYPQGPVTLEGGVYELGTLTFELINPPISCAQN